MKKHGKTIFSFFLALILFGGIVFVAKGQTCNNPEECQKLIDEYTKQISTLQGQANTLKNQIAQFDAQIKLTSLKVKQTEEQITLLGGRIDQLEGSLDSLTEAFSSRAVETYKLSKFENNFSFVLTANDVSDAVNRFHYLQKIQEEDRSLLNRLQEAQTTYISEKADQETLQKQLKTQQANLSAQKSAKNNLLSVTKNDEAKYQKLLAAAKAEYDAIIGITAGKGVETQVGHVNQGDRIANVITGSSCNSGGTHLHFIVRKSDKTTENPLNHLKGGIGYENCSGSSCGSGDGDQFNPSGSWDWPINPTIKFSQGYGSTWAVQNTWVKSVYSFHNGIDINGSSSEVKAVRSGTLYRGSYNVGCQLRYVRVDHDDSDLDTLYLHINY